MLLSQQFFYLLIGLGVLFGLPAFWLFSSAMWPQMTAKARTVASRGLLASFLIGLPLLALALAALTKLGQAGQVGGLIGILFAGLLAMWSLAGLAGLASHIGLRLWPDSVGTQGCRAVWRGGFVTAGVLAIPFIGWFVLFGILLAIGLGMRIRMWFTRLPQPQTEDPAAVAPPLPAT